MKRALADALKTGASLTETLPGIEAFAKAIDKLAVSHMRASAPMDHTIRIVGGWPWCAPWAYRIVPWVCPDCHAKPRYSRTAKRFVCKCPSRRESA